MISDSHIHTNFSGDSSEDPHNSVAQAIKLGMEEMCITDHHDFPLPLSISAEPLEVGPYVSYLQDLQRTYEKQIFVGVGIELGLDPMCADALADCARSYPWDFIIGSVHHVHAMDPYYPLFFEGKTEKQCFGEFFEATLENLRAFSDFDTLGHLDYVVRYGPNKNKFYRPADYFDIFDEILRFLIDRGICLECNVSALRRGLGQPNPHPDLLRRYRELGGELITIGSDAHKAIDIGVPFDVGRDILLGAGFTHYAVFKSRKPQMRKL